MAEVTPTAEEAGEEVKGIMVLPAPATLLTLLEPLVSILVVDFAGFRDGESFVGFGDFDEFLFGRFIAPGFLSMGLWGAIGEKGSYGFLSGWYFLLSVLYARLISRSPADLSIPKS
jgi:hypothetical protein